MAIQEWRKGTFVTAAELFALGMLAHGPMEYVLTQKSGELAPQVFAFRALLSEIEKDLGDERRGVS